MARLDQLGVTFHAKLGTQGERVQRIARLAREAGADRRRRSRRLPTAPPCSPRPTCTTEVVGEFPELQGAMGRKYALLQGEHPSVAAAIEEHYKPQGPSDRVPTDPVSVAVALADKLDTLVGFWAIDEKPTGSKDPYALRRAALGVIRIVVENGVRLPLSVEPDLLAFFHDRLKVYLRDQGARHDLIDAVITPGADDLLTIVRRVEALGSFLDTEDGKNLLAGTKRAANILAAEEKKGTAVAAAVDPALFRDRPRRSSPRGESRPRRKPAKRFRRKTFPPPCWRLAHCVNRSIHSSNDVLVNDEDAAVRANRLALLALHPRGDRPGRRLLEASPAETPRPGLTRPAPASRRSGIAACRISGPRRLTARRSAEAPRPRTPRQAPWAPSAARADRLAVDRAAGCRARRRHRRPAAADHHRRSDRGGRDGGCRSAAAGSPRLVDADARRRRRDDRRRRAAAPDACSRSDGRLDRRSPPAER